MAEQEYNKKNTVIYTKTSKYFPPSPKVPEEKRKKAMDKLNLDTMKMVCTIQTPALFDMVKLIFPNAVLMGRNIFVDRGANILGVAHRDTYGTDYGGNDTHFFPIGSRIYNASLDDRAGVYILVDWLLNLGLDYDILITTDEEMGMSSAWEFKTDKEYNWMFQFDRAGTDVVTYQYKEEDWMEAIRDIFPKIGTGSFTDIRDLDLGICGMNIGTAYYDQHSSYSYFSPSELSRMIALFVEFYTTNKDTKFEHEGIPYRKSRTPYYGRNSLDIANYYQTSATGGVEYGIQEMCEECGKIYEPHEDSWGICDDCWDELRYESDTSKRQEQYCDMCGSWLFPEEYEEGVCNSCRNLMDIEGM